MHANVRALTCFAPAVDRAAQITNVLVKLKPQLSNCFRVLKTGRESTFNPLNIPQELGSYEGDPVFRDMLFFDHIKSWIALGFLVCPFNIDVPGALDVLGMVLQEGFVVVIWEDELRLVHPLYDAMFDSLAKRPDAVQLTKPKKLVRCVAVWLPACVLCWP